MSISVRSNYTGNDSECYLSTADFISRIGKFDTYEIIPDTPFKYNFDFDLKPNIESVNDFDADTFNQSIVPILQKLLCEALACKYSVEPIIKIATSNGLTADKHYKYSARFYCQNILANRDTQKAFVIELNERIKNPKTVFITDNNLSLDFTSRIAGITDDMIKFDNQVYSNKRKMRCVGTSKPNETRPLVLYADTTIQDTILSDSFHPTAFIDSSTPQPKIITNSTTVNIACDDKYIELMHLIGNKINRALWLKLTGWAVNHISKQQYLDFVDAAYIDEADKMWNDLYIAKREVSIFTIENIAKQVCPLKYKDWCKQHKKLITLEILERGERDVCEFVADKLNQVLIFCNNKWYAFNEKTHIWDYGCNPTAIIVRTIQDEISLLLAYLHTLLPTLSGEERTKIEKSIDKVRKHYSTVTGGSYSNQCKKCLEYILCDNEFYKKLNKVPFKIPFKNGIYHLDTKTFVPKIEADDFISATLQRNYTIAAQSDIDAVRAELLKICNCNETHLEYYLSVLGYAFCGVAHKEQAFWSFYGATASNGKSTIFDALAKICPELVSHIESKFFEDDEKTRHKTLDTLTSLTRIIYANELNKKKQDREFIKQIADGTHIPYNRMYANKVDLNVNFKAFIISNNILNFDNDNGIARRIRTCEFTSSFSQDESTIEDIPNRVFKADKDFPVKLQTVWSDALLNLIFDYSFKYCEENKLKTYPTEWKEENNNVIASNNIYAEIFENEFEYAADFYVHKNEIADILKERYNITYSQKEFLGELKRFPKYKVKYEPQMVKKVFGRCVKGWWVGMKCKQLDIDIDNNESVATDIETSI